VLRRLKSTAMPPLYLSYSKRRNYEMQKKRQIEMAINEGTVRDLIAEYLYTLGVVRYSEDVSVISMGQSKDNVWPIVISIEPKTEVIYHE
jgi:hypothetical protein